MKLVRIYRDFFPEQLLNDLHNFFVGQSSRKQEHHISACSSARLDEARAFVESKLNLTDLNFAITKKYDVRAPEDSGAYTMHIDPPEFSGGPLVLCTIYGSANLAFLDKDGESHTTDCLPNTVIVMDPSVPHSVTAPLNDDGLRYFLFLGHKNQF